MRELISRSSLCNVAIECTENAVGGLIYDHFPWLETTLVHISGGIHEMARGRDNKKEYRFSLRVFGAGGIVVYAGATCLAK